MASATVSVGGRPPMMASGPPLACGVAVELDGLLDRVTTGGGGDVDELLDVPPGRLGPIGVDIEAAVHPRRITGAGLPEDARGTGTSRSGRGPRGARGRRRRGWAGRSSGLLVRSVAGGADDLPERGVEPIGDGGAAVGDAADRSGVAAKAEPARADHQLRTGQRRRLGVAEQVGDELTGRLAGGLLREPRCSRRRP